MDKSWMEISNRTQDRRYKFGVEAFLAFAYQNKIDSENIPCPCRKCNNYRSGCRESVLKHLLQWGMSCDYVEWIYHGENSASYHVDDDPSHETNDMENDEGFDDGVGDMLNDLGMGSWSENWQADESTNSESNPEPESDSFHILVGDSHKALWDGCKNYSHLAFIVNLLSLKTSGGWTVKSFDDLLQTFQKSLPTSACIPKNFYECKKYIRSLGLPGKKIHACINDCVLFHKNYKNLTHCPNENCKEPRFMGENMNIPRKVLRYFPLIPRLRRMFMIEEVARDMRWHKDKRVNDENIMRHPADSYAWKHFDSMFPTFAKDPRSVRLGLATDGFNPFGNLNSSYSIWPVFVFPYNLPPWKCMKDPFLFMPLLIPGPKSPGQNIDVYLEPLIDELKELWAGVGAYDAYGGGKFTLYASLMWTINDFPAYSMLSGWCNKGYNACPICLSETDSSYLSNSKKICYMGHRRFLDSDHSWRKDKKNFNGHVESRGPIAIKTGQQILDSINDHIKEPYVYGAGNMKGVSRKRKRGERNCLWKKKSIFFQLPYWKDLKLRHNIDIMHVVKNVTESLVGTMFDIKSKSKDGWKARQDLMNLGLKRDLHLKPDGDGFKIPLAAYNLKEEEKIKILNLIKELKFPDGLVSNISRCVKGTELQVSAMKSHDYYVLIQRVFPVAIKGCLTKEVRVMLYELSEFFRKLCSRTTYVDVMRKEQKKVALLLCKFEKVFPPSFFDIMVHLLNHLSEEAIMAGSPQYRWMFPFERKMGTLTGYVHNTAKPEGCIAERYMDKECLSFCAMYMRNVESNLKRVERNDEVNNRGSNINIFSCTARTLGRARSCNVGEADLAKIHLYILQNCDELEEVINEHKLILEEVCPDHVVKRHNEEFASWFRTRVTSGIHSYMQDLRILSMGLLKQVTKYQGCLVNGYRFHVLSRERNRKTQNSGVVVKGDHGNNNIDFYGVVKDIIEVEYVGHDKRVVLFKCDWIRLDNPLGFRVDKESGLTSINMARKWYIDRPYVLAQQVKQVFYIPDLKLSRKWHVVQDYSPRSFYDVPEKEQIVEEEAILQDDEPSHNLVIDLTFDEVPLARGSEILKVIDADTVNGTQSIHSVDHNDADDDTFIDDDASTSSDDDFSSSEEGDFLDDSEDL